MDDLITDEPILKGLADDLFKNKNGLNVYSDGNQEWEAFYTTFPDTGWKLVAAAPTSELYSSVKALLIKSIVITLLFLIVSIVIIYIYSSKISKNIKQFVEKIEFLAKGDLTNPTNIKSNDELGQMSLYYNHALDKLKDIFSSVRSSSEQVAASAEELSASAEVTSVSITEVASSI